MRKILYTNLAFGLIVTFFACTTNTPAVAIKEEQPGVSDSIVTKENTDEREPNDEELREYGLIKEVEDGAYPMFSVTVEFPERKMSETFNLNVEESKIDINAVYKMKGSYATIFYLAELKPDLIEMTLHGATVMYDVPLKKEANWKLITGQLSGADSETTSDLPGKINIVDKAGRVLTFDYYVDKRMMQANGKEVKAFYTERSYSTISYLKQDSN